MLRRLNCFRFSILLLSSIFFIIPAIPLSSQYGPVTLQDVGKLEDYSNLQCFCLYQDSSGLLWISNLGGIDRWDGNRMVNYPYNPFDSLCWPDMSGPLSITRDDQNNLWCTESGLIRLELEKELFSKIPLSYNSSELTVRYVKYDPEGFLWLICKEGIYQYNHNEVRLKRIPRLGSNGKEKENYRPRMVNILRDTTGRVWMSDNHLGLFYYEPLEGVFKKQVLDLPNFVDEHMNMLRMKEDPHGDFWLFGNKAELARFNPYTRDFEWAGLSVYNRGAPTALAGMAIDNLGRIWFGVDRGLMLYNPVTRAVTPMDTLFDSAIIMDMISDQHGNILLATIEGVKIIDPQDAAIRTVHLTEELSSEGANWITSVARDGQTLWMGTFKTGIIRYDLETDQFVRFRADNRPGGFDNPFVSKTLRDRNGRIWFTAGLSGSLYRVASDNSSFEQFHPGSSKIITQCDEGFFWIIDPERIVRFDPITQDTVNIRFRKPLPINYVANHFDIIAFIRDKDGIFWFGQQDGGLYRIDPESREWSHYNYDIDNPEGLPNQHVRNILCDSRGSIWLSTWTGVSKIIQHKDNDTVLTFDNHLIYDFDLSHTIKIREDIHGNIFVGTLSGLMVIRPDGTFDKYTHKDGLPKEPSMIWMMERDHENGAMYLGCTDIAIIPSGFFAFEKRIAPTLFTELRIGGEKVHPGKDSPLESSILTSDRIDLRHDQNFFRIDFTTSYFSHPERNSYRYFLEGIDQDTVYSGNQSFAEYTDLAPGNYTFWVTGAIHRGTWNPKGASIEIIIHPPWYESMLAIAIYAILFITLVLGYIRIRTSRLKREKLHLETEVASRTEEIRQKNQQIQDLDSLKTRFFNNISHEFRTLVTMVKAPAEFLMEEEKLSRKGSLSLEVIYRNAKRLMNLVSQLLDISRIDRQSIQLALCEENIFDFAHEIAVSFAPLAEAQGIQYRYYLPRTDTPDWFDADKIEKIMNNLLSNAFKFTDEGGRVQMDMVHRNSGNGIENLLELSVTDTGKGIPEEEHEKIFDRFYQAEASLKKEGGGTGIGLALTHNLVELMHGSIQVKSSEGKGSTFTVRIPLGLDHLDKSEYSICDFVREGSQPAFRPKDDLRSEKIPIEMTAADEARKPLLLVVEDNADILWLLASRMATDFRVIEAVDGSAGLKLATEHNPDLVITDLMMPRMDGTELCEKLKTNLDTSHIPVIMLTAKASMDDKMAGLEIGADDYITKPFEIREVQTRSRNLVEQRRKLREKFGSQISLDPMDIVITSTDEKFLTQVMVVIDRHMSDEKFDVSGLCEEMHMSRSTLFRKLDALTNQSPVEFIRTLRLKRAAVLLKENYGNISEVALEVGFSNPSYFSKMFKKAFSVSPGNYSRLQTV